MLLRVLLGLVLQVVELAHCAPPSRWSSLTGVTAPVLCRRLDALPRAGCLTPRGAGRVAYLRSSRSAEGMPTAH
jgi:hypothetical protein